MTDEPGEASTQNDNAENAVRRVQTLEPPQILPQRIPPQAVIVGAALFVGAVLWAAGVYNLLVILSVIFGLSAIVMMHEGAHFVAAKLSGMKVTEFFVGFGPRVWSTKKGETEYGAKALLLGGYVRIIGMTNVEEVPAEDEARTYRQSTYPRRVITTAAGIISHFILAWILAAVFVTTYGLENDATFTISNLPPLIGLKTPAQTAGLKPGDKIVSYDGIKTNKWDPWHKYIESHLGKQINLVIERHGTTIHVPITPMSGELATRHSQSVPGEVTKKSKNDYGYVGISPKLTYKRVSVAAAPVAAAKQVWYSSYRIVRAVGSLFSPSGLSQMYKQVVNDPNANNNYRLSSPVGITRVAGDAAKHGFKDVLGLLVMINLSLGIFNLLPLLPLDGGHIAIATYEAIRSRRGHRHRVDIRKIAPLAYAVAGLLILLSLTSLYLDIARPLSDPFH